MQTREAPKSDLLRGSSSSSSRHRTTDRRALNASRKKEALHATHPVSAAAAGGRPLKFLFRSGRRRHPRATRSDRQLKQQLAQNTDRRALQASRAKEVLHATCWNCTGSSSSRPRTRTGGLLRAWLCGRSKEALHVTHPVQAAAAAGSEHGQGVWLRTLL